MVCAYICTWDRRIRGRIGTQAHGGVDMGAPVPSASHKARTIISYFILYISTPEETLTRTTRPRREGGAGKEEKTKSLAREKKRDVFLCVCVFVGLEGGRERQMEEEYVYVYGLEKKKEGGCRGLFV